jgi:hypothetical protein
MLVTILGFISRQCLRTSLGSSNSKGYHHDNRYVSSWTEIMIGFTHSGNLWYVPNVLLWMNAFPNVRSQFDQRIQDDPMVLLNVFSSILWSAYSFLLPLLCWFGKKEIHHLLSIVPRASHCYRRRVNCALKMSCYNFIWR